MADTATQTDVSQSLEEVPLGLIDPDPKNRSAKPDKDFIQSIRSMGVVEPILIVPSPESDGRYLLVAGERRWRGAKAAKLETIPAVVRIGMDEKDRVEAQVIENMQREDLRPGEEAAQILRLTEVGHNVKSLATAIGCSQTFVRSRLKLAELPAAARKLVDSAVWTIEDAHSVHDLADHPEAMAEIIEHPPKFNVPHAVSQALGRIKFDAELEKLRAKIERDQLTVVDEVPRAGATLSALGIDVKDHQGEECHAYTLNADSRFSRTPALVGICTKSSRHRVVGPSEVKSPNKPGMTPEEREERARKKEASETRAEAMEEAISGRLAKGDCYELILAAFFTTLREDTSKPAAALLGLTQENSSGGKSWWNPSVAIQEFASKSEPNRLRAAVVVAMVMHEQSYLHWNTGPSAKRWFGWLKARGWVPTAWDRAHIKPSKSS